jgi:hypothetical protein
MAIGEVYDTKAIARDFQSVQLEKLQNILKSAGPKDVLKKVINTNFGKHGLHIIRCTSKGRIILISNLYRLWSFTFGACHIACSLGSKFEGSDGYGYS